MPKDFYRLLVIIVMVNSGIFLIAPLLPSLLLTHGFSISELSLPFALLILSRIVIKPIVGYLLVWVSARVLLVIISLLQTGIFLGYHYLHSKPAFLCLRILEGLVEGTAILIVTDAVVVLSKNQGNQGLMMGLFSAAFGFGFLLGPMISTLTFYMLGESYVFLSGMILSLICLAVSWFFKTNLSNISSDVSKGMMRICIEARAYLPYFIPQILRRVTSFSLIILLPLTLLQDIGIDQGQVGYYFALSGLTVIIVMPLMGKLADNLSPELLTIVGLMVMSLSFIVLGVTNNPLVFTLVFIVETLAFCLMLPAGTKIFSVHIVNYSERSIAIGAFSSLVDVITLFIALSFPYLYNLKHSLPWGILGFACLVAVFPYASKPPAMPIEAEENSNG